MAKHRGSERKSRFGRGGMPRMEHKGGVYTGEILSLRGEAGISFGADVCFPLILQVKDKNGDQRSIVWHIQSQELDRFLAEDGSRVGEGNRAGWPLAWIRGARRTGGAKDTILRKLETGEIIRKRETDTLHPADILDAIVDHLHSVRKGGARIRVTMVPGSGTLEGGAAERGLMKMKRRLEGMKLERRIHNLRTRGMSDEARTRGVQNVEVAPSGRIYRV